MKICSKCKVEKEEGGYYYQSVADNIRMSWCKECSKAYDSIRSKEYHKANRGEISKKKATWRLKNVAKIKEKSAVYYIKNRKRILARTATPAIRKQIMKNIQRRYKVDPNFRLRKLLSERVRVQLRANSENGSAVKLLGCTMEFFKGYLEGKFQSGMTWENMGAWHIDHILPLASFDLTNSEQAIQACHYTNLQPLWAADNIRKGAKIISIAGGIAI